MRRKTGPVQQWVDSIPSPTKSSAGTRPESEESPTPPLTPVSSKNERFVKPTMTVSSPIAVPGSPIITGISSPIAHNRLVRDPSFQSDSSHCSSVESLLELRRADPEAILLGLGFGGCPTNSQDNGPLSRIPKRFLQPSKLQGIAINDFVKHQQETGESLDSASLGYRGLTGSPYVAPSEIVQKIMERLREHESHEQDAYTSHNTEPYSPIFQDTSRLSVLSPDNRQFLERPRSKSPDMRNKRMIIGQKSFAFGCDGDWIEINPPSGEESKNSSTNGNTDNHDIDDKLELEKSTNDDTTSMVKSKRSTNSNARKERRLSKQKSIDESARYLNIQDSSSSVNDDLAPTRTEISRSRDEDWIARDENSDEDCILSENPRRASCDSCDTKKMPHSRLSRDDVRRHSDGNVRKENLYERRKSLRRQTRINDEDCEARKNLIIPEIAEKTELIRQNEVKIPRFEDNETERRIKGSDRLSETNVDKELESSRQKLSNTIIDLPNDIDLSTEIKCAPSTSNEAIEDSTTIKREKKRKGLSTVLGIYNSAMSVKMEPGF